MRSLFALLLLAAGAAQADYKSAYQDGTKAAASKNWRLVQNKMNEAIADNATPQARLRLYGMVFEPYVPHFYLALAAYNLGDCPGALRALSAPGHSAALQESGKSVLQQNQQQILTACKRATPAPVSPVVPPPVAPQLPTLSAAELSAAQTAIGSLQRELASVSSLYQQPALRSNPAASKLAGLKNQVASLELDLAQARTANDVALLASVRSSSVALGGELAGLKRTGQQLAQAAMPVVVAPVVTPPVATPPPPVAVARIPAPAALRQLAESYFRGDLASVERADLASLSGKALAQALLLRAAARYSLYVQTGELNAEQLSKVRADLRQAKQAQPGLRPSSRYFSPRLIQLFGAA